MKQALGKPSTGGTCQNSWLEAPAESTIYRNPAKAAVMGYKISQYCRNQKGSSNLFSVICILRGQRCLFTSAQRMHTGRPADRQVLK